jgi:hypothetical protein
MDTVNFMYHHCLHKGVDQVILYEYDEPICRNVGPCCIHHNIIGITMPAIYTTCMCWGCRLCTQNTSLGVSG